MEKYLTHTKDSFNKIAGSFDEDDKSNEILQWMRNAVYEIYLSYFEKGQKVIELNAGTGIDALFLASQGIRVFATDISDEMISRLTDKVEKRNLQNMITAENYSFEEIHRIEEKHFDGAISNFGGLNCTNNFDKLIRFSGFKNKTWRKIYSISNEFILPVGNVLFFVEA